MTTATDIDHGQAIDLEAVAVLLRDSDSVLWKPRITVRTYTAEQEAAAKIIAIKRGIPLSQAFHENFAPIEVVEDIGNALTRQGLRRIMDRLAGTASNQALDATHCRIGVGDGSTAFANTDTDLSAAAGSTHRQFELVDSAPSVGTGASSGVLTFVATFETGDANFPWTEWGIDGGTADGTTVTSEGNTTPGLINRKVTSLVTKTSSVAATITVTITIT